MLSGIFWTPKSLTPTVTVTLVQFPVLSIDITASDSSQPNTWVAIHVTKEHFQLFNNIEVAI